MMYLAIVDYGYEASPLRHYHGSFDEVCAKAQEWADDLFGDVVDLYELIPGDGTSVTENLVGKFHQAFDPVLIGDPRLSSFFLFGYEGEE